MPPVKGVTHQPPPANWQQAALMPGIHLAPCHATTLQYKTPNPSPNRSLTFFSGRFERIFENQGVELKRAQITLRSVGADSAALVEIVYRIGIGTHAVIADVDSW